MKCLRCQHENPPQSRFCFECGARFAPTCSSCGAELPAEVKFCNQCGQAAAGQVPANHRLVSPETYTPKHLAEKILTSKAALEGERKQVTVLFADLKGSMELLADRDPEEARKLLDPVRTPEASPYLAYAFILLGERERGLEYLARALDRSTTTTMPQWYGYGTMAASAYLAAECPEEARAEIRHWLAAATEWNASPYRAPLLRLEAKLLEQADPSRARERFEEALALAAELGMRPEVAHCRLGLGKLDRRTGQREQARAHLTTAAAMYRDMDMRFWLEQAEAESMELGA